MSQRVTWRKLHRCLALERMANRREIYRQATKRAALRLPKFSVIRVLIKQNDVMHQTFD